MSAWWPNRSGMRLESGDVITRLTDTADADQNVTASVAATKKGDCASAQPLP